MNIRTVTLCFFIVKRRIANGEIEMNLLVPKMPKQVHQPRLNTAAGQTMEIVQYADRLFRHCQGKITEDWFSAVSCIADQVVPAPLVRKKHFPADSNLISQKPLTEATFAFSEKGRGGKTKNTHNNRL